MSYGRSTAGSLMGWITQAFKPRLVPFRDSTGCWQLLCVGPNILGNFNAYLESCELHHEDIRGRVILNVISREFDTDRNTGACMTALELYNRPPSQDNLAALRQWCDKVNYVRY